MNKEKIEKVFFEKMKQSNIKQIAEMKNFYLIVYYFTENENKTERIFFLKKEDIE